MSNNKRRNYWIKVFGGSAVVMAAFMLFIHNQRSIDGEAYAETIASKRAETDQFMRTSTESPFNDELKAEYSGLNYFAPDPKYRVQALIKPIEKKEPMIITTSDGKKQRYIKFAYAEFKLDGERYQLLLLKQAGMGQQQIIFTAFADATSGESTYGGGRYLDLNFKNARQITLDFNLAYNPFCAYNATFSCPLPPSENVLPIPILAGEKNFEN